MRAYRIGRVTSVGSRRILSREGAAARTGGVRREDGMNDESKPTVGNPLIRALAEVIRSAARNTQRWARFALEHDGPIAEPCACRADVGDERCVCAVELPMSMRWRRRAAKRLATGAFVGRPPERRCRLCVAGDHDFAPTYQIKVSVAGRGPVGEIAVPVPRRKNRRHDEERAKRAGALAPGTIADQRARADQAGTPK